MKSSARNLIEGTIEEVQTCGVMGVIKGRDRFSCGSNKRDYK